MARAPVHTGKRYRLRELLLYTKRETLFMAAVASVPTVLSVVLGWRWIEVPWVPIAMLGTASAFTVGFRNNATYARAWEARQIWGAIVNTSRTWGIMVRDLLATGAPTDARDAERTADASRTMVHRHIAWLTALRYQLREPRGWENMDRPDNIAYQKRYFAIPERDGRLAAELARLLGDAEATEVLAHANRATAILALQSAHLRALAEQGALDTYRHVALVGQLEALYDHQGRCERIKSFPYPRQFATLNYWFIRLFVWLVPFGMLQEFHRLPTVAIWLTVPFSVIVTWLFLALEKIGEATENPFEGNANDIPITALSRTIEIDLRQMLGERDVPPPLAPVHNILM
jgi:putative membrane protein